MSEEGDERPKSRSWFRGLLAALWRLGRMGGPPWSRRARVERQRGTGEMMAACFEFPEMVMEPGDEGMVTVGVDKVFRMEKLEIDVAGVMQSPAPGRELQVFLNWERTLTPQQRKVFKDTLTADQWFVWHSLTNLRQHDVVVGTGLMLKSLCLRSAPGADPQDQIGLKCGVLPAVIFAPTSQGVRLRMDELPAGGHVELTLQNPMPMRVKFSGRVRGTVLKEKV